jgi:phospho-N-acetylmuramoyl-pentapeptide-transferase
MSPLHHHFELGGLHEVQVTTRFVLVGLVLALAGVLWHLGGLS